MQFGKILFICIFKMHIQIYKHPTLIHEGLMVNQNIISQRKKHVQKENNIYEM